MNISIRPAELRDKTLIKNIFNLYQNELSIYSDDFGYLDENGYFAPETADEILPFGDGVFPYIVLESGRPVGFVMATDASYAPDGCDYCLEELFLIRKMRGKGAAGQAVNLVMQDRSGRWALEVYEQNAAALSFWTRFLEKSAKDVRKDLSNPPFVRFLFTI